MLWSKSYLTTIYSDRYNSPKSLENCDLCGYLETQTEVDRSPLRRFGGFDRHGHFLFLSHPVIERDEAVLQRMIVHVACHAHVLQTVFGELVQLAVAPVLHGHEAMTR